MLYTYIHPIKMKQTEFEKSQGGVQWRVWREMGSWKMEKLKKFFKLCYISKLKRENKRNASNILEEKKFQVVENL